VPSENGTNGRGRNGWMERIEMKEAPLSGGASCHKTWATSSARKALPGSRLGQIARRQSSSYISATIPRFAVCVNAENAACLTDGRRRARLYSNAETPLPVFEFNWLSRDATTRLRTGLAPARSSCHPSGTSPNESGGVHFFLRLTAMEIDPCPPHSRLPTSAFACLSRRAATTTQCHRSRLQRVRARMVR
jgi:hypothetical protein